MSEPEAKQSAPEETNIDDNKQEESKESELKITSIELYLVTIPLVHVYVCGDGTLEDTTNVICKIKTNKEEFFGYGESNPDPGFTEETKESICNITKNKTFPLIVGKDPLSISSIEKLLDDNINDKNVMAKGMINMALWDIYGKYYKKPVYK
eukprot:483355_1